MLHTNPAFYRSTRESAFTLILTFAQIRALMEVKKSRDGSNANTRRNREIRGGKPLDDSLAYFDYIYPDFVEEGDGTGHKSFYGLSPSERCLMEKGLIAYHRHLCILTRAGYLTLQLLEISGHIVDFERTLSTISKVPEQEGVD